MDAGFGGAGPQSLNPFTFGGAKGGGPSSEDMTTEEEEETAEEEEEESEDVTDEETRKQRQVKVEDEQAKGKRKGLDKWSLDLKFILFLQNENLMLCNWKP